MTRPRDHTNQAIKRGPVTRIRTGRGVRPWLPEVIGEPGWVSVVTRLPTLYAPPGPARRVCWRCVRPLDEHDGGHTMVWCEDAPPVEGTVAPGASGPSGSARRRTEQRRGSA